MSKAAPLPLRRIAHQSPLHWIVMHISQLVGKLACVPDIAIVIALLPERSRLKGAMVPRVRARFLGANLGDPAPNPLRKRKLQIMDRIRQHAPFRFAHQQMDMLRHHHISVNTHRKQAAHIFKSLNKQGVANDDLAVRLSGDFWVLLRVWKKGELASSGHSDVAPQSSDITINAPQYSFGQQHCGGRPVGLGDEPHPTTGG